jgi:8-oxo-dGTP pyrophosphatase MutT (NUDIX family)
MSIEITLKDVCAALALPDFDALPAQSRMAPGIRSRMFQTDQPPREAGVLVLLFPDHDLHIVLTRRNEGLRGHSGQISFPGGQRDADDPSFTATALRETCEELGLCGEITILGTLSQIYIPPSNFNVYPSVGYVPTLPDFQPSEHEVAEVFSVPLHALLDPSNKCEEDWDFQDVTVRIPYYHLNGHKVWGATAVMLSEFEHRLRVVLEGE